MKIFNTKCTNVVIECLDMFNGLSVPSCIVKWRHKFLQGLLTIWIDVKTFFTFFILATFFTFFKHFFIF